MSITGTVPLESLIGSIVTIDGYEFDGHVIGFRVSGVRGDILISMSTGNDLYWNSNPSSTPSFHCQSAT